MFLLNINDIGDISSSIRLFSDSCVLYRVIEDHHILQSDLNTVLTWSITWQMKFNIAKCATLQCSRSPTPSIFTYQPSGYDLSNVNQHTYLGVTLTLFSVHINNIITKAWGAEVLVLPRAQRVLRPTPLHLSSSSSLIAFMLSALFIVYVCILYEFYMSFVFTVKPHHELDIIVINPRL